MALKNKSLKRNNQNATLIRDNSKLESQNTEKLTAAQKAAQNLDPREEALAAVENPNPTGANSAGTYTGGGKTKSDKKLKIGIASAIVGIVLVAVALGAGLGKSYADSESENARKDQALAGQGDYIEQVEGENDSLKDQNEATLSDLYNNVAKAAENADTKYTDAISAFEDIGANPNDENYLAIKAKLNDLNAVYEGEAGFEALYKNLDDNKTAYANGTMSYEDYKTFLNDLNTKAGAVSSAADALFSACENYNVYSITFSQSDLSKSDVQNILRDKTVIGKVTEVESCKYSKNDGSVEIVAIITEASKPGVTTPKTYTTVLNGNIGANKTTLTVDDIIEGLKNDKTAQRQTYEENESDMGAASTNSNIKVQYYTSAKKDAKGNITSKVGALVKFYGKDGKLESIKQFTSQTKTDTKDHTSELKAEIDEKIQEIISAEATSEAEGRIVAILPDGDELELF